MKKNGLKFLLLGGLLFLFNACFEANEACLDFYASNYNLSADVACEDCCEFPNLIMQFSHRWDSIALGIKDTLIDDFDHPFIFENFEFLIDDIMLIDNIGEEHRVEDSISLNVNGVTAFYKNDFEYVSNASSSYTIGIVKIEEAITSIKFRIGIGIQNINYIDVDEDFVLLEFRDSLSSSGSFIPWQFDVRRDTSSQEISVINGMTNNFHSVLVEMELNNELGSDIRVPINIEYRSILQGVNIMSDTQEEIITKIQDNLSDTFN